MTELRLCAPVGGRVFLTNMKIAFSGLTFIRFRITYTNWPTVRSAGTRYLQGTGVVCGRFKSHSGGGGRCRPQRSYVEHTQTHFFLSMSGISLLSAFSTMTCTERVVHSEATAIRATTCAH